MGALGDSLQTLQGDGQKTLTLHLIRANGKLGLLCPLHKFNH